MWEPKEGRDPEDMRIEDYKGRLTQTQSAADCRVSTSSCWFFTLGQVFALDSVIYMCLEFICPGLF